MATLRICMIFQYGYSIPFHHQSIPIQGNRTQIDGTETYRKSVYNFVMFDILPKYNHCFTLLLLMANLI